MLRALGKSMLLHLVVIALAYVGVPHLFEAPPPQETVTTATFVPIAEARNLPDVMPALDEPEPEPEPSEAPPPPRVEDTPPPPPPPEPEPEVAEPPPEPEPEPEVAEPLPEPVPEPVEVAALPQDIQRPRDKPTPPPRLDFESALQSLEEMEPAPRQPDPEPEAVPEAADPIEQLLAEADTPYRFDIPLSQTEIDTIRSQIQRNWSVPAGARDAHEMRVTLRLQLGRDGSVERVEVDESDRARMLTDPFYRSMAESAVRAVRKTGQIQYLSPEKYEQWRDIKLTFDPREMYG
jgi:outer membrane biosynthesis protein TonB